MFQRPVQRTLFDLAFGVYTAILALIVVALLTSTHYLSRISLATACIGFLIGVALATARDDLTELLVRTRLYLAVSLGPLLFLLITDIGTTSGIIPDANLLQDLTDEALVLAIVGVILYGTTMNCYAVILQQNEDVLAEWFGRADTRYLRFVRILSFVSGLVFLASGLMLPISIEPAQGLFASIGGVLLANAVIVGKTKHFTLVESGLLVKRSGTLATRFIPRQQLRSVEYNEDVLTLHRGFPWPVPFRCRLGPIPDSESVTYSLQKYVDGE
ncbi:hypothetical protein [Haladaptatus sp. T7]|uniref:hypothetical protein n=1 Tax=Haladaptatus sp. T7 TaxID=2029368 RepID=UPI0021A257F0|nr:hypothetical protein [Haladaptatus sp. T7]GKZ15355.1 hypothetical protein HAL_32360 [Haladaptatus sp. T7]